MKEEIIDKNMEIKSLELLLTAENWLSKNNGVAIATVIRTWGSSPRPVGSQMIVSEKAQIEGSVSGGCIEGSVIENALEIISGQPAKKLDFGVTNETAWQVGLTCGGKITIFIESFKPIFNSKIYTYFKKSLLIRNRIISVINLSSEKKYLLVNGEWVSPIPKFPAKELEEIIVNGKSTLSEDAEWFFHFNYPSPRLLIVGAVHIAQALAPMASTCGFNVEIIDPRGVFATKDRFPLSQFFVEWPEDYLIKNPADKDTAIVTLTHDPKLDDPVLEHALNSKAFYIACLGSKKTHSSRLERLKGKGFNNINLGRLNGPAGIPISAKSPSEIAVSILAEMIKFKQDQKNFMES